MRNVKKKVWTSLIFLLVLLLSACGYKISDPLHIKVNQFNFINQDNEPVGLDDLNGKVWIADFIFTNCTTVCIPMMSNMVELQELLKDKKMPVDFVSFTVDPEFDTPEILKEYATEFNADLSSWQFLTGYTQPELESFAMDNFRTYAKKPEVDNQVIHGTSFFLVDKNGVVVKEFSGLDAPVDDLLKDLQYLLSKESK